VGQASGLPEMKKKRHARREEVVAGVRYFGGSFAFCVS
jgi:hypothetical protein